jgi:hypothetical protein
MSYDLPPQRQEIYVSAGTAFKIGFFGFFGAFVGSLIIGIIMFVITLAVSAAIGAAFLTN